MIDGHLLGLPGGSPGLGEITPGRLGPQPQAGKRGLVGMVGAETQVRAGGVSTAERRGSILGSPDFQAGSPAMESFIQDWLKSKGVAKDVVPETPKVSALPEEGLAAGKTLQPKESAPTETSAPEPASRTSTYNRRAWEIARAARQAAIDVAAEAAARATSNPSSSAGSMTSPTEDTESTPVDTTIAVTPTDESDGGGTSTGDEESSSDPGPGSGGADGTGETEEGSGDTEGIGGEAGSTEETEDGAGGTGQVEEGEEERT